MGGTQHGLLRALLHNKPGLTVDELTGALSVSRNAVRQHLTALERDGVVGRGRTQPTGGRPEQVYVITEKGQELFPRQYSWFSEMLIDALRATLGEEGSGTRMAEMGRSVGAGIAQRLPESARREERVAAAADAMGTLGYEAKVVGTADTLDIEAQNCVFHQLAMKYPEICRFDLALLSNATGQDVEHRTCMARGDSNCCFRFTPRR
jgi:predicted ArsR family transcriptional regulator